MRRVFLAGLLLGLAPIQGANGQPSGGPVHPPSSGGSHTQSIGGGVSGPSAAGGGISRASGAKKFGPSSMFGRTWFAGYGTFYTGPAIGFFGLAFGGPLFGPPIAIVVPPPVVIQQSSTPLVRVAPVAASPPVPDPKQFIVVRPDNPAPPPPRIERKPPEKKVADVDLGQPGNFPLARGPAANPQVEANRQIETGKEAFAKGEYGVALEHFRRAAVLQPDEAAVSFLLAQAQFAVGKYDDAAATIIAGIKRNSDWPQSRFQSSDVYGKNRAAYDVHLQNLRDALAVDPDDPRLLFLLGVELWFDGKRDQARPLFERVVKLANDAAAAEAFLKTK